MFDLTGRLALVTDAGQRTGAGIAHYLARQGAHVVASEASAWMTGQTLLIERGP